MRHRVLGLGAALAAICLMPGCAFDTAGPLSLSSDQGQDAASVVFADGAADISAAREDGGADSGRDIAADRSVLDVSPDTLASDISVDMLAPDVSADTLSPDLSVDSFVPPDGWISDALVSSCAALYGAATNYELCDADAKTCSFAFDRGQLSRITCNTLCGGSCVDAHDNVTGTTCRAKAEPGCIYDGQPHPCSCFTNFISGICICSR